MIGPFYLEQVPATPLQLSVVHADATKVDLSDYDSVDVRITDSSGTAHVVAGDIVDSSNGVVQLLFPAETLFTVVGEYSYQVVLTSDDAQDFTLIGTFEVRRPLEEA